MMLSLLFRKYRKILLLVPMAVGLLLSLPAQKDNQRALRQWHREATRLYNLDEPDQITDSTAFALYMKAAPVAEMLDIALAIDCYIKAGNIRQGQQRYPEANRLYHQAIALNQHHQKQDAVAYEAYLYLGSSLYFSNVIDSAQHYFEAASEIAMSSPLTKTLPEQERLYNSLGAIYFESANYQQAKNYFDKALEVASPEAGDYNDVYTGIRSNIANCLMKLNRYDSALRILVTLDPEEGQKELIRQNTAYCYYELGKYDSAITIYQSLSLQNGFQSAVALTGLGRIYMRKKEWLKAEVTLDSAIARNRSISKTLRNKEEALAYLYRSQLARAQGLTDEALTWVNEALQEVHLDFTWKKAEDLPEDIRQSVSPITLFSILHEKARIMRAKYSRTGQASFLDASLNAYRRAIETANFIKLNFDNDEAKQFFNNQYWPIYQEAVEVCSDALKTNPDRVDDYIFIVENYKGNILHQNIQDVLLKSSLQIPDSIRAREKQLKQLLAVYTSRINQSSGSEDAAQLRKRILSLQVELSRLQKIYEQDEVYSLSKNQQITNQQTLSSIQQSLAKNTALLNFFYGDSSIFCLAITRAGWILEKTSRDRFFETNLQTFISEIYHHNEGKRYEGAEASAALFQSLVKPVEKLAGDAEAWVIIPDGPLFRIPFEALMPDAGKREYMVQDKAFSYHYSYALLLDQHLRPPENANNKGVLAFAPYREADASILASGLQALPYSEEEVKGQEGRFFGGKEATKRNFLAQARSMPILHLATHASTGKDSNNNWIQFYPEENAEISHRLFLPEIYQMDLQDVELVILSACETGGGLNATGEGLLSLSRAFMYAGADGVISTLWKTEDRVTAFLMKRVHEYLEKNLPVEKALQMAKKDLLKSDELGVQYKLPNYWAGFIYSGKLQTTDSGVPPWTWWIGGLILAVFAGYLFFHKRERPQSFR